MNVIWNGWAAQSRRSTRSPVGRTERRRASDRRQRDGLGLLTPVADPRQRRRRQQANVLVGLLLVTAGGGIEGGSVASLQAGTGAGGWLGLMFGLITLAQGVWLVGQRERRSGDRRSRER